MTTSNSTDGGNDRQFGYQFLSVELFSVKCFLKSSKIIFAIMEKITISNH